MDDGHIPTVSPPRRGQKALAVAIALATLAYLVLAVNGIIKPVNRLTGAEFGIVVVAAAAIGAALKPEFFERLQKFDFAGIKFELTEVKKGQEEVQKNQQAQQEVLEDIRLALRLLIGPNERSHLLSMLHQNTSNYRVRGGLRDEIRRLRAMRLIKMREGKSVGGMPDKDTFDLAAYVELTEDGVRFTTRLANQPDQTKEAGTAG